MLPSNFCHFLLISTNALSPTINQQMQFLFKFSQEFNPKVPPEDDVRAGRYSREPKLIFNVFIKYRFGSVPSFAKVRAQKTDFFHNLKVHGCHRNFQIKSQHHIPSPTLSSKIYVPKPNKKPLLSTRCQEKGLSFSLLKFGSSRPRQKC